MPILVEVAEKYLPSLQNVQESSITQYIDAFPIVRPFGYCDIIAGICMYVCMYVCTSVCTPSLCMYPCMYTDQAQLVRLLFLIESDIAVLPKKRRPWKRREHPANTNADTPGSSLKAIVAIGGTQPRQQE